MHLIRCRSTMYV